MAHSEVQPQIRVGEEGLPGDELREGAEEDVRSTRLRVRSRPSGMLRQDRNCCPRGKRLN